MNNYKLSKLTRVFYTCSWLQTDNPVRRIIQYAISLGGDTDTIASMAGAIAGAYFGIDEFNTNILKMCEDAENIDKIAEQLYQKNVVNNNNRN